jgi:hypothetical protein
MTRPFIDDKERYFPEAIVIFFVLLFVGCLGGLVAAWLVHELLNGAIF